MIMPAKSKAKRSPVKTTRAKSATIKKNHSLKTVPAFAFLYAEKATDYPGLSATGGAILDRLMPLVEAGKVKPKGPCIWMYDHVGGGKVRLRAGFPVAAGAAAPRGFKIAALGKWKCATTEYKGSMAGIAKAWDAFTAGLRKSGLRPMNINREVYRKWIAFDSPANRTDLQVQVE
jgi:predicted transcriptional regulator YdeE